MPPAYYSSWKFSSTFEPRSGFSVEAILRENLSYIVFIKGKHSRNVRSYSGYSSCILFCASKMCFSLRGSWGKLKEAASSSIFYHNFRCSDFRRRTDFLSSLFKGSILSSSKLPSKGLFSRMAVWDLPAWLLSNAKLFQVSSAQNVN